LKASVPSFEKALADAKSARQAIAATRATADAEKQAAAKALQEKEQAGEGDIASAKDLLTAKTNAASEAAKKLEDADTQIKAAEAKAGLSQG
jgi:hypothetical protein